MKLKIFGLVAMFACLHAGTATADSSEFPFDPNQQSYLYFLNNEFDWNDGKKRVFTGLGGCSQYTSRYNNGIAFGCKYGYVKVTDLLGSKLCELQKQDEFGVVMTWGGKGYLRGKTKFGNEYPCKPM